MASTSAVAIADDSWGAEGLEKQGEKLASSKGKPVVLVDDELLNGPPPEAVKKLCDEILALNVTEVHQLLQLIQVRAEPCCLRTSPGVWCVPRFPRV
jgi:hypothetical protein